MTPILFNTRDELIKVDIDKMIYAMAEDNYVHLFFRNSQSVMVCTTQQLILSDLDVIEPIVLKVPKEALKVLKQTITETQKK